MTTTGQFRKLLDTRPIKCAHVNCTKTFSPSGRKKFCSDNCRKSQNKLDNASDVVVISAKDKPSAVHVCLLEGCGKPLANNRQKYCCEQHRKKASNKRLIDDRREYDRQRDTKVGILALKLGGIYYSYTNTNDRIRFLESLIDIAFNENDQYYSIIRRMMRNQKWRQPDLADKTLFHRRDSINLTISEILENYCQSFYAGSVFQLMGNLSRPQPSIHPAYMQTLDTRVASVETRPAENITQFKPKASSPKPEFDDEEPAEEFTTKKNFVDPVVYENIDNSNKRWKW